MTEWDLISFSSYSLMQSSESSLTFNATFQAVMGNKPSTSEEGTEILREYNDILKGRRKISTTVSWDTSTIDIRGMRQKIFQLQKGISQMKKFHLYKIHNSSAEIFFRQKCYLRTCFTINSGQHKLCFARRSLERESERIWRDREPLAVQRRRK